MADKKRRHVAIGGVVTESHEETADGRPVCVIDRFDLHEVSLVYDPADPFCIVGPIPRRYWLKVWLRRQFDRLSMALKRLEHRLRTGSSAW